MARRRTALVVGASGHVGSSLTRHLADAGDWDIVGVCRRPLEDQRVRHVAVDLLDARACHNDLALPQVTHIFYCARAAHAEGGVESVADNLAMLTHAVEAVEAAADCLEHIHLVEGGKWYGVHLGPYRTPAREDDPRHLPPNFYYDQEDWLRERQRGRDWTWSASRPSFVCGVTPRRGRNLTSVLGAYAALCREFGVPLDFPGDERAYTALNEMTDAQLLAGAIAWAAVSPGGANQAFNITNGDLFRWCHIWPRLAGSYGIPVGEVRRMSLARWMSDKEEAWARILRRYDLRPTRMDEVANWAFADFVFGQNYDVISDTGKLRRAGFHASIDSTEMIFHMLDSYRSARILP